MEARAYWLPRTALAYKHTLRNTSNPHTTHRLWPATVEKRTFIWTSFLSLSLTCPLSLSRCYCDPWLPDLAITPCVARQAPLEHAAYISDWTSPSKQRSKRRAFLLLSLSTAPSSSSVSFLRASRVFSADFSRFGTSNAALISSSGRTTFLVGSLYALSRSTMNSYSQPQIPYPAPQWAQPQQYGQSGLPTGQQYHG